MSFSALGLHTWQYGTIGSAGRTTDKPFADAAAAAKYVTQQIAAKKKKGYVEKVWTPQR